MRDGKKIEYFNELKKVAKNKVFVGAIEWFDRSSGKGFIFCEELNASFFVHKSAFHKNRKIILKGQKVAFTLYVNFYMAQIESARGSK